MMHFTVKVVAMDDITLICKAVHRRIFSSSSFSWFWIFFCFFFFYVDIFRASIYFFLGYYPYPVSSLQQKMIRRELISFKEAMDLWSDLYVTTFYKVPFNNGTAMCQIKMFLVVPKLVKQRPPLIVLTQVRVHKYRLPPRTTFSDWKPEISVIDKRASVETFFKINSETSTPDFSNTMSTCILL